MRKVVIIALTIGGLLNKSIAQSVSYKIVEDNPNNIKNLAVHLDPFYADAWWTNPTLGFGIRGDYMLGKLASFNLDFRKAYMDANAKDHVDASLPTTAAPLSKYKYFYLEMGGDFHLLDKNKSKNLKVVLSSSTTTSGNYQTTHTKYIMVPGTIRKIWAVRAGVFNTRTAFAFEDAKKSDNSLIDFYALNKGNPNDTMKFGDFGSSKGGGAVYNGYSVMNMAVLYVGISRKWITNLIVDTDYSSKKKGNTNIYDFYVDYLIAPAIRFKDIESADGTTWALHNDNVKRTGWRVGLSYRSSTRSFLSYKFEYASRPGFGGAKGILGANNSLLLTIGWTIPFRLNILPKNETETK